MEPAPVFHVAGEAVNGVAVGYGGTNVMVAAWDRPARSTRRTPLLPKMPTVAGPERRRTFAGRIPDAVSPYCAQRPRTTAPDSNRALSETPSSIFCDLRKYRECPIGPTDYLPLRQYPRDGPAGLSTVGRSWTLVTTPDAYYGVRRWVAMDGLSVAVSQVEALWVRVPGARDPPIVGRPPPAVS